MLIPKEVFAIADLSCKDATRANLTGVRVERDAGGVAHAVATDGRRIAEVRWQEPEGSDYPAGESDFDTEPKPGFAATIPAKQWAELGKAVTAPKKTVLPVLACGAVEETGTNGAVRMQATDLKTRATFDAEGAAEVRYPDWRAVLPRYERLTARHTFADPEGIPVAPRDAAVVFGVNPKLLADALLAVWKMMGSPEDRADQSASVAITVPVAQECRPLLIHSLDHIRCNRAEVQVRAGVMGLRPTGEEWAEFPHPQDDHETEAAKRKAARDGEAAELAEKANALFMDAKRHERTAEEAGQRGYERAKRESLDTAFGLAREAAWLYAKRYDLGRLRAEYCLYAAWLAERLGRAGAALDLVLEAQAGEGLTMAQREATESARARLSDAVGPEDVEEAEAPAAAPESEPVATA